jgi:D-glycero-D-manno-heptose 1,7-bisphosphate phosphatase
MQKQRAVFIDRDGVINVNRVDHVRTWEQFVFEAGALDALCKLGASDFRVIVITNQAAIGRGQTTRQAVEAIHAQMTREIVRAGGRVDRVYFCPHLPEDGCACRKPQPEMLLRGRAEFTLEMRDSFFIGDWVDDVRAARSAGVTPILVRTGRGERALGEMRAADVELPNVFKDLGEAVAWILERERVVQKSGDG